MCVCACMYVCMCWEQNLDPLEEQQMLLTREPFLQALVSLFLYSELVIADLDGRALWFFGFLKIYLFILYIWYAACMCRPEEGTRFLLLMAVSHYVVAGN